MFRALRHSLFFRGRLLAIESALFGVSESRIPFLALFGRRGLLGSILLWSDLGVFLDVRSGISSCGDRATPIDLAAVFHHPERLCLFWCSHSGRSVASDSGFRGYWSGLGPSGQNEFRPRSFAGALRLGAFSDLLSSLCGVLQEWVLQGARRAMDERRGALCDSVQPHLEKDRFLLVLESRVVLSDALLDHHSGGLLGVVFPSLDALVANEIRGLSFWFRAAYFALCHY